MANEIDNIELRFLKLSDYEDLKETMVEAYKTMPSSFWKEIQIKTLIEKFSQGQVVLIIKNQIAGCALSIIINKDDFEDRHTYKDITSDFTFDTHTNEGDTLYGIDVFIKPQFRGLRLGKRLYDFRKNLCEQLNLSSIVFGGRIPNYHK